jgi:hypothetical protein
MRNGQRSLRSPVSLWYRRRRAKRRHSLRPEMERPPAPVASLLLLNFVFISTLLKCPYGALEFASTFPVSHLECGGDGGVMQHGWAKIVKGPDAFAVILQALHVPFPHLSAYLTISVELLGGAALLSARLSHG